MKPRVSCALRLLAAFGLVWGWAVPGYSQLPNYSHPRGYFPNPAGPYSAREVPAPTLINTPRINGLLQNGKLLLSLNDAIALALENNLDIAIARYNLNIADTDILRAKAGSATRGVNTGLVQGTPGGGVGGFGTGATGAQGAGAGGTTGGAGGAGTGSSGLVTSTLGTGSNISSFDPILQGTFSLERAKTPLSNTVFTGVNNLSQNSTTANFTYSQGFATGTNMSVGFNNSRTSTNAIRTFINPTLNSSFRFTLSQHLLQGFGFGPNQRFIKIAKNNREISDVAFRLQVITTVNQIQNIYWDLVNAYEDVKVKERSLALAEKTLSDNKKQVEIGTLAPIEIVRAQSEASTRKQDLIVSQTNLQLQQLLMKNALSRSLTDAALADAEVIPTDTMQVPAGEEVTPTQDLVNDALAHRAELAQARIDLVNRDITKKSARNALLPSLDAFAFYGASGLGGDQNALITCGNPGAPAPPDCIPPGTLGRTSFGGTFGNLFDSSSPDKGAGLQLTIPIRNRSAQADQVRSELEYRQAQMRMQQLENQIRIEVRNAVFALQQNRARVDAARAAVELGRQSLDAEQKKYALGASTNTLVLQAQRDLAQAESNLVAAQAAYEKSRVELDRATGLTLSKNSINIADAESGQVRTMPNVPGVVRTEQAPPNEQMQPPPPQSQEPPQQEPQQQQPPQNPQPQAR
jgi:outer membrane protein TolC